MPGTLALQAQAPSLELVRKQELVQERELLRVQDKAAQDPNAAVAVVARAGVEQDLVLMEAEEDLCWYPVQTTVLVADWSPG